MVRTSKDGRTIIGESWSEMGVVADESRGQQKTICPNCGESRKKTHDKSLSVDATNGVANCHHCGMRYVIDRYKGNISKVESTKDYKLPPQEFSYDIDERVASWFDKRKISLETLKKAGVTSGSTYMPQRKSEAETINFNYMFNGTRVNVKYRDGKKNFKFESGAKLIFYNLDCMLNRELTELVIVEGEIDALSYIESGVSNVISVPNGASKGSMNLDYLTNSYELFDSVWRAENGYDPLTKIVIATDDDEPGQSLKAELIRRLGAYRCYETSFKGHNDPNELLMAEGKVALFNTVDLAERVPIADITEANDLLDELLSMKAAGGLLPGAQVGSDEFQKLWSFEMSRLTTVTGIPSHGKTQYINFLSCLLAIEYNWVFALFSPESFPIKLHASNLLSLIIGRPFNHMTDQEIKSGLQFIHDHFVWIYPEDDNYKLRNILNITRDAVRRYGVNSLVIDPWTEVDKGAETDTEGINVHLTEINQFKRAENIHVFLVAHPTKMQKDPVTKRFDVPDMYDISGSANFYNKTDGGMTVYRNMESETVEIYQNKVKFAHLGKQGHCTLKYNVNNGRYQDIESINKYGWDNRNWLEIRAEQLALQGMN
jgi:twinkle protein